MLLNYEDVGPGPVVVLLHGFPLDSSMWEYQYGAIGSMYRIIAPDLRGHGKTAAPDGVYTIGDMADDVIETLDALGINEPVVVGGHSMGGYVALSIAVRYPERLRGLVLINTRASADTADAARGRETTAKEIEATGRSEAAVSSMLGKLFAPGSAERQAEHIERIGQVMRRTRPRTVVAALRGMATRPDRTADLARITVPTLVLAGSDDQLIPPLESRRMAEALPNARLVMVPDAGHMAPLENPVAVDEALHAFLGSLA
jgi:pimeloyl-ACP methyl ester carboxylesterase